MPNSAPRHGETRLRLEHCARRGMISDWGSVGAERTEI